MIIVDYCLVVFVVNVLIFFVVLVFNSSSVKLLLGLLLLGEEKGMKIFN